MTYLGRLARRLLDRLLDRWHEGPEPPVRIAEEARMFRHHYPDATPDEWERFAIALASNAYRDAFVRGFQWNERCWPGPDIDPAEVAQALRTDVSIGAGDKRVARMLREVPRGMTAEQKRLIAELAASPYPIRMEFEEE